MLVVHRDSGRLEHRMFCDLPGYLLPGDLLVLNDSKVIHARLFGIKEGTGAKVELFLLKRREDEVWEALAKPAKRLKAGTIIDIGDSLKAEILDELGDGSRLIRFYSAEDISQQIERLGKIPLPPYIKRIGSDLDDERYQTVYSMEAGSVAAPTAGLHFTEGLLERIVAMGVETVKLTLHVGLGTFRPVKTERIEDHHMHGEDYFIPDRAAEAIMRAKAEGRRVICVGTTSVRAIESASKVDEHGAVHVKAGEGNTDIFIYPGYEYRVCDGLLTNFHLPKSTLLMLVSAFYDREKVLMLYEEAISEGYRFFSYGDAMLLL